MGCKWAKMTTITKIDTKLLLDRTDLADLIVSDLGQPAKVSGKYIFFRCPFHDDKSPSMAVTVDRYYCFGCRANGDAIAWLMNYRKLSFMDACRALSPYGLSSVSVDPRTNKITEAITAKQKASPDDLQASWHEIINTCQAQLWSDVGKGARDYLHDRGINDQVLQSPFFRVGFSEGKKIAGVWVDRGIVLPCFTVKDDLTIDYISYVKIRRGRSWVYRPDDKSKYRKLPGMGATLSGLYGAGLVKGSDAVFFTEGEFDCLLLHQEAGDLVGVCTLGGVSDRFDWSKWGSYISFVRWLYIAYDIDEAGNKGAAAWSEMTGRVRRARIPDGKGKDITDAWRAGVDLAGWVMGVLADYQD